MSQPSDTSPEVRRLQIEVYRRMSPARKWELMGELFHTAKVLHAAGVRARNPAATDQEIHDGWMALSLGRAAWEAIKEALRVPKP